MPPEIARDFEEALNCDAHGFDYATALVARRVLQSAARDVGGTGNNLAQEIESIPDARLPRVLKDAAHQVRFIGNDAAHANGINAVDVKELVVFSEQLLNMLYVIPETVRISQTRRP